MKHIIILLACLSSMPLWAQRSIKIEAIDMSKCSMMLFNQDSTSLELMSASFKARKVETIVVEFVCSDIEVEKLLNGANLYLVIKDFYGIALSDTDASATIDGIKVPTYAQAVYRSEKGVRFEVNLPNLYTRKGTSMIFSLNTKDGELKRKLLLLN